MNKRLAELVDKKFLTEEEIEEIYLMENVYLEYNGYSGTHTSGIIGIQFM